MTHNSSDRQDGGETLVPGASQDPASPHHAVIKTTTQARSGVALGSMRWVLGISIAAVVIAFVVIWTISANG